jgi:alkanesulfonate monooxygenase SsuD/methylene tetrahydromethanopterin reductase-like flavin-dependent oxidoreductase (luciferase family)
VGRTGGDELTSFGLLVPQGFFAELAHLPPAEQPEAMVAMCTRAEAVGFESLWVGDHLTMVSEPFRAPIYEAWTTITMLSQRTSRIRLGQLVMCNPFRHPGIMALMAANLDVMSGGRLELGLGAGWLEHEFRILGMPFPSPRDRIRQLREAVEVIRALWRDDTVSYDGDYYTLHDAVCDVKPLQSPAPPITVAGIGSLTLGVVAAVGDNANFFGSPGRFGRLKAVLHERCDAVSRDPADVGLTWYTNGVLVRETEREAQAAADELRQSGSALAPFLEVVGSPAQVAEQLHKYVEQGCRRIVMFMSDAPGTASLDLVGSEVIPALTGATS